MTTKVLVTGAGGFIGQHIVAALIARGCRVRAASSVAPDFPEDVEQVRPSLSHGEFAWDEVTSGMDAVLHLAGRAHVLRQGRQNSLEEFRRVNSCATLRLARQAVERGVRRFIFVSSIGVIGSTTTGVPFTEDTVPTPIEPYAISKWEAEQALQELAGKSGLELTIVRLPLVYGTKVKGNFLRLLRLVGSGIPLPLGAVQNLRSYVGVDNVCDFLALCLQHPAASGELFLLADGEDLSTPDLIRAIAASLKRPARLYRCPLPLLQQMSRLVGYRKEIDQLTGSLQVDASHARRALRWVPPVGIHSGISAMGAWYRVQYA